MKFKLTQNMGLKIGSLVFAAFLWIIVTNINDPVTDKPFSNIPVKIINTERLEEENKVYEVLEGTDIIGRVTVWAPTSVLGRISSNNIVATADLADLSSLDTIGIKLSLNNNETITRLEGSIDIVKLKIEEQRSKTITINPVPVGTVAEGYLLGDIITTQNVVRITGPESLINSVVSAETEIDVSGATRYIATESEIILLDVEGNQVNAADRIEQNIREVGVEVEILETKSIPVNFLFTGTPAAGYLTNGTVESSLTHITVAGQGSAIRNIDKVEIPETRLDITGSTENFVAEINLLELLEGKGVELVNDSDEIMTITVYIEPRASKEIGLDSNRINIINMPEGFSGSISGLAEDVSITLTGLQSNLDLVRGTEVSGIVDVAQLMEQRDMEEMVEGFYTTTVTLNLVPEVSSTEPVEVLLHVTAMEDNE
ncbi:MAG: hypothetical protein LBV33_04300 [Lachnospiraceae bacterium]|jgi:YbbR domain-containing protein|nr:hypothetical protein [Lachnospiraceae bacterium]